MADCKTFRGEIEESAGVERLSLETRTHAGICRPCGEFEREHNSLRSLVAGLGKVEAPADFEFRLRARMKSAKREGGEYTFLRLRLAPGFAWAAAACFLVVSASLYIWQERSISRGSQEVSRRVESGDGALGVVGEKRQAESESVIKKGVMVDSPTETIAVNKAVANNRRVPSRRLSREKSSNELRREVASINSSEFSLTGAKVLRLKIPVSTLPESLRFIVRDERGNTRPVPMRAVSFGSQELVAGENARARVVSTHKGEVW